MKQAINSNNLSRRLLPTLALAAALTVVGCSSDVNVSPTEPDFNWTTPTLQSDRSLQISGSLEAEDGTCLKATILYNGKELKGARTACPDASGCARLELSAETRTISGRNTISFNVLRQSADAVDYVVTGNVLVTRDGLSLQGVNMPLGPRHVRLRPGGDVTFDIVFSD